MLCQSHIVSSSAHFMALMIKFDKIVFKELSFLTVMSAVKIRDGHMWINNTDETSAKLRHRVWFMFGAGMCFIAVIFRIWLSVVFFLYVKQDPLECR